MVSQWDEPKLVLNPLQDYRDGSEDSEESTSRDKEEKILNKPEADFILADEALRVKALGLPDEAKGTDPRHP